MGADTSGPGAALFDKQISGEMTGFSIDSRSVGAGELFYTHNLGIPELRGALAAYVSGLHRPTAESQVAVTSAGVNALMLAVSMARRNHYRLTADEWRSVQWHGQARYVRFSFSNPNRDPVIGYLAEVRVFR